MAVSLQSIFQAHFEHVAATKPLADYQRRAAWQICNCRTRAMGGHVLSCPDGHMHRVVYHSCGHRSCPQCAALARERRLAAWKERLLDTSHMHIVFAPPHELIPLWRYNKKDFAKLLFQAATQSLAELLADEKYLGATPGMLAALHTWGQKLDVHTHLHVLVTFGGLTDDGRWVEPKKSCLLPRAVLMAKFRGKLRALLLKALTLNELTIPPDTSAGAIRNLLNRLGRVAWNVKLLDRYDHGRGVVTYLARYLRGGPIGNGRIIAMRDGRVLFRYRDHRGADESTGRGPLRVISLAADDFIARVLEHVPPRSMQTVRGYGLYANSKRADLAVAREHFGQAPTPAKARAKVTWREMCERAGRGESTRCPVCGAPLVVHCHFERGRDPPRWALGDGAVRRVA